jgi:hypothetical protein
MARPKKVQSNIPSVTQPSAVAEDEVLNSEQEELYYRQVMTGEIPPPPNPVETVPETMVVEAQASVPSVVVPARLFLVEGKVKLESTLDNSSQVADQRRIVNATDVDEALQKFVKYYENMSNEAQTYSVLQAGASETIL